MEQLISGPNPTAKPRLLSFSRTHYRAVTDLLTGHNTMRRHLYLMGLTNSPLCRGRAAKKETSATFCVSVKLRLHSHMCGSVRSHRATHCLLCINSSPRKAFVMTQPTHSPDLAPSDFWLFPSLKMDLKGPGFATMEDIECDDRTPEDSKRSLPPELPTMAG